MDYNDINAKLERIYTSINRKNRYGGEILSGMRTTRTEDSGGKFRISISFGNDAEALNQIYEIISNLANLKDCLMNKMKDRGKEGQLIEEDINMSAVLPLVLDLSNQEKHGYPLKKVRRSKKDPQIQNIYFGLGPSNKPDNIEYSASDGAKAVNMMVSVHADIVDGQGKHLYKFDELVERAITDWEDIIRKNELDSDSS
jgi:hypothetical protein